VTRPVTPVRLAELAAQLGRGYSGDGELRITGAAALDRAGPAELAFLRSASRAGELAASRAGALILPEGVDAGGRPSIPSANPALDFARAVETLYRPELPDVGIDSRAVVAADAQVDGGARIGAGVIVGARCRIAAGATLFANVTLYPDVEVGADCVIHSGVVLREGCVLGERVVLQPGVVLGGDGFGYVGDESGRQHKMPQIGTVVVEDDVEIGANSTVDRGTLSETRIRRGAKIDNLVQIAHNCEVGEDAIVAAQTGLSGSTRVGRAAVLMGQVGAASHLRVGAGAFVGARSGLHKDVPDGARVWGTPQMEERSWHRAMSALARLPDALRRLRAVERALGVRGASRPDEALSTKPVSSGAERGEEEV